MKNIFIYLLSNIANGLLPLAFLPLYTKYLTPEEYGFIALFQVFFIFFRSMNGASYVTATSRNFFSKGFCNDVYTNACFNLIIVTCFILSIVSFLFSDYLYEISDLKFSYVFKACASGAFSVLILLRLSQWQVRENALKYGIFQVLLGVGSNFSAVFLIVYMGMGVQGKVDSVFYTYMIFALFCYFSLLKDGRLGLRLGAKCEYKDIIAFSLPLLPHSLGVLLLTIFDRFVLKVNLGLEIVGIYMVAFQLMSSLGILSDAFNKFFSPVQMKLLAKNSNDSNILHVKYIYIWSGVIILCGLLSVFVLNFFTLFFLDEKYQSVIAIFPWLALGQIFNGVYLSLLNIIYFSKKTAALSVSTILISILHVCVFYLCIFLFGFEGAGIAFSISMAIRLLITFVLTIKVFRLPWMFWCCKNIITNLS